MSSNTYNEDDNQRWQIPEQSRLNFGGKRRKTIKGGRRRRRTNKRKRT